MRAKTAVEIAYAPVRGSWDDDNRDDDEDVEVAGQSTSESKRDNDHDDDKNDDWSDSPTSDADEMEKLILSKNHDHDDNAKTTAKATAPAPSSSSSPPPMLAADTQRAAGICLVILYHMGYERFQNAWICISCFFSLSGFLITKTTVEAYERRGFVDIPKFYAKRISRLFPALLVTVILIVLSQKLPYRKREHDDGITFQREATDLWYATIFATNFNLVYNQVDDYFDEFTAPSITRHLWTLSIEEQYYIMWPLVIWTLTKLFGDKSASSTSSKPKRGYLWAIVVLDTLVIVSSYVSSHATIKKMGMSAAYFSTWCRMGDVAMGGLVYSASRLMPSIANRLQLGGHVPRSLNDNEDLKLHGDSSNSQRKPMTCAQKVLCELIAFMAWALCFGVPMTPVPVKDMLPIYFRWLRFAPIASPLSVVSVALMTAEYGHSSQLPLWAVATRLWSAKSLIFPGIISYGVYVFHWPIIVYFGDPNGMHRKKVALGYEEETGGVEGLLGYKTRDFLIVVVVFTIGYLSFNFIEKPALMKSRQTRPIITIVTGLSALLATLVTIWIVTKDLEPMATFENDDGEIFGSEGYVPDFRYTPIISTVQSSSLYHNVLDYQVRPKFGVVHGYDSLVKNFARLHSDSGPTVIVMCKTHAKNSPCRERHHMWKNDTYWVWLESQRLCSQGHKHSQVQVDSKFHEIRCNHTLTFAELHHEFNTTINEMYEKKVNRTTDTPELMSLILDIDELLPGVLNQNSISRIRRQYQDILDDKDDPKALLESSEEFKPIEITLIGESVAERIGMFFKDIVKDDLSVLKTRDDYHFPSVKINNLGHAQHPAIAYFTCLSSDPAYQDPECHHLTNDVPQKVLSGFPITKPDAVVIHDTHWQRGHQGKGGSFDLPMLFQRVLAFNNMAKVAIDIGAQNIFYLTLSPSGKIASLYSNEMNVFLRTVDTLACSEKDDSGIRVTLVNWALLICPEIEEADECNKHVHGFENILPDGVHPFGESGLWLTRTLLAVIIDEMAQHHLQNKQDFSPMGNPISKTLLALAPPDGNPRLTDIVSSYYLCPYSDSKKLEAHYNATMFRNYTRYDENAHLV